MSTIIFFEFPQNVIASEAKQSRKTLQYWIATALRASQ
jgi:hypothetical protein